LDFKFHEIGEAFRITKDIDLKRVSLKTSGEGKLSSKEKDPTWALTPPGPLSTRLVLFETPLF
jgi:hypothetical protein